MTNSKRFDISIKRRIPFLSTTIYYLLMTSLVILAILYVFMMPGDSQSDEMKAAYFYFVVPMTFQRIFIIALVSFIFLLPLNKLLRQYRPGKLTFFEDHILITGNNFSTQLLTKEIMTIYISEKSKINRRKKSKRQLAIRIEDINLHMTNVLLTNYNEAENFVSWLSNYDKIKLEFKDKDFNFSFNTD